MGSKSENGRRICHFDLYSEITNSAGGWWINIHEIRYGVRSREWSTGPKRDDGLWPARAYRVTSNQHTVMLNPMVLTWKAPDGYTYTRTTTSLGPLFPYIGKPFSDGDYVNLYNRAVSKFQEDITNARVLMPVTALEARKSCDMAIKAFRTVVKAAKFVRKFKFREAAAELGISRPRRVSRRRTFESNWMEYRYGWGPLASEVSSSMKVLWDMLNRGEVSFARGVAMSNPVISRVYSSDDSNVTPSGGFFAVDWLSTEEHRYKVVVTAPVKVSPVSTLHKLGLVDLAEVAYEAMPFSWMLGWFHNVGAVLANLTAYVGVSLYAPGSLGHSISRDVVYRSKPRYLDPSVKLVSYGVRRFGTSVYERKVLTSLPYLIPAFNLDLTPKRAGDLLALTTMALRQRGAFI